MGSPAVATTEPHERGILFTGPNVLKILAGSKTQTRRIISCIPDHAAVREIAKVGYRVSDGRPDWIVRGLGGAALPVIPSGKQSVRAELHCPYGKVGDRLWVREAWRIRSPGPDELVAYRADCLAHEDERWRWKPSIHMPRWASRLTLEITDVRVERLQEISEEDATAEGVKLGMRWADSTYPPRSAEYRYKVQETPREAFARSWDELHGVGAWDSNPWCWAITFRMVTRG